MGKGTLRLKGRFVKKKRCERNKIMVTRYGFTTVEADSESEALRKVETMRSSDFDWSKDWASDAQIVDEID